MTTDSWDGLVMHICVQVCSGFLIFIYKPRSFVIVELGWLGSWLERFIVLHSFWHEKLLSLPLLHHAVLFFQDFLQFFIFNVSSSLFFGNSCAIKTDRSWRLTRLVHSLSFLIFICLWFLCMSQDFFWGLNLPPLQFFFLIFLLFL